MFMWPSEPNIGSKTSAVTWDSVFYRLEAWTSTTANVARAGAVGALGRACPLCSIFWHSKE